MRWLYADPNIPEERRHIETTSALIDAWWRAFAEKTGDLDAHFHGRATWDLPDWIQRHLQVIHPALMWEFGSAVRTTGHRLVITPESERWLRPMVGTLLERAPKIDGWELYPYRLAEDVGQTLRTVRGRVGVDVADATVEILPVDEHRRIGLRYTFKACRSDDAEEALHAAFVATETLLGEQVLDQWIGAIRACPRRLFSGRRGIALGDVRAEVMARVQALREALPGKPCIDRDDDPWSILEPQPRPQGADDYPRQSDLLVGKSMDVPLWHTARGDVAFFSDSFSRCGETFCYVKTDGIDGLDEEHFADKGDIEDALDEPLRAGRVGGFIGGGTGLRYSYIDLALLDVERGIEIVRDVLRRGNIHRRTWILFFDDSLRAEWIGIWPDTPPPPGGEE